MMTLDRLTRKFDTVPAGTAWYLQELGEARGKQELFTRQSPQKLKTLREHALVESAVSSNRIEGVLIRDKRVATVVFGKALLQDRDEEEVRGYRQALTLLHEQNGNLTVSEELILRLHRMTKGEIWDAGQYKEKDGDIIEKYPDGRVRVRFRTVTATDTLKCMQRLTAFYHDAMKNHRIPPLIVLAAFNLDFLCIHPFRDGNGRVSRLLLLLQCYHLGFEVGRYISIERLIEENKEQYYETLELSSRHWHEGRHDPWPYINFLLFILRNACNEFEQRMVRLPHASGEKTEMVLSAIHNKSSSFTIRQLQKECPLVSIDMIRRVLKNLRSDNRVECLGRGQAARWQKTDRWELGNPH